MSKTINAIRHAINSYAYPMPTIETVVGRLEAENGRLLSEVERLEKALAHTKLKSASFDQWWEDVGSRIPELKGDDAEEHAKTVSRSAWVACYAFFT